MLVNDNALRARPAALSRTGPGQGLQIRIFSCAVAVLTYPHGAEGVESDA